MAGLALPIPVLNLLPPPLPQGCLERAHLWLKVMVGGRRWLDARLNGKILLPKIPHEICLASEIMDDLSRDIHGKIDLLT